MSAKPTSPTDLRSDLHDNVEAHIPQPTVNHNPTESGGVAMDIPSLVDESETKPRDSAGVEETDIPELLDASPAAGLVSENGIQDDQQRLRPNAAALNIIATWFSQWVGTGSRQIDPALVNSCNGFHVGYNVRLPEDLDEYDQPLGDLRLGEVDRWADNVDETVFRGEMRPN